MLMQLALLPSSRLQFKATGSDRRYIHMSMCLCVGGEEMERKRNRPLHLISSKELVGSAPPPTSRGEMHICRHRSTFCRQRPKRGAERTPLGARIQYFCRDFCTRVHAGLINGVHVLQRRAFCSPRGMIHRKHNLSWKLCLL